MDLSPLRWTLQFSCRPPGIPRQNTHNDPNDRIVPNYGRIMAQKHSKHQDRIIHNYYANQDALMIQRLGELITDLYLAEGDAKVRLWKRVGLTLEKLKIPKNEIQQIVQSDNPTLVANLLQKLLDKSS